MHFSSTKGIIYEKKLWILGIVLHNAKMRIVYKVTFTLLALFTGFAAGDLFQRGRAPRHMLSVNVIHDPDMPITWRVSRVDPSQHLVEVEIGNQRDFPVLSFYCKFALGEGSGAPRWFSGFNPAMNAFFPPDPDTAKYLPHYIPPRETRRVEFDLSEPKLGGHIFGGRMRSPRVISIDISLDLILFGDGMVWGKDESEILPIWRLYFERFPIRARLLLKKLEEEGLQEQLRWAEAVTVHWGFRQVRAIYEGLRSEDPARRQAAMDQKIDYFLARMVRGRRNHPDSLRQDLQRIADYRIELWRPNPL